MCEELYCNFRKCHKPLSLFAFVTSCSHVFCEEHGNTAFNQKQNRCCPACQTSLAENYDFVKTDLNPSDQFKSMVLTGLKPEIVMEIASRAISFWSYQKYQEHLHQDLVISNLKESINTITTASKAEMSQLQTDLENFRRRQFDLEKKFEVQKVKTEEANEKLVQKTRELSKLQGMVESLKKKQLTTSLLQHRPRHPEPPVMPPLGPQIVTESHTGQDPKARSRLHSPTRFEFRPQMDENEFPSPKVFLEDYYRN